MDVMNSTHFTKLIQNIPDESKQIISLDVMNLYTKFPTEETPSVIQEKLVTDTNIKERPGILIGNLMEMLIFCAEITLNKHRYEIESKKI